MDRRLKPGGAGVTPKRWAFVAWGVFLAVFIGIAALAGGRNCEVPKSGLFHSLLSGRKYAETHSHYWRIPPCRLVK